MRMRALLAAAAVVVLCKAVSAAPDQVTLGRDAGYPPTPRLAPMQGIYRQAIFVDPVSKVV